MSQRFGKLVEDDLIRLQGLSADTCCALMCIRFFANAITGRCSIAKLDLPSSNSMNHAETLME
jgi:hypothetical protein